MAQDQDDLLPLLHMDLDFAISGHQRVLFEPASATARDSKLGINSTKKAGAESQGLALTQLLAPRGSPKNVQVLGGTKKVPSLLLTDLGIVPIRITFPKFGYKCVAFPVRLLPNAVESWQALVEEIAHAVDKYFSHCTNRVAYTLAEIGGPEYVAKHCTYAIGYGRWSRENLRLIGLAPGKHGDWVVMLASASSAELSGK